MPDKEETQIIFNSEMQDSEIEVEFKHDLSEIETIKVTETQLKIPSSWFPGSEDFFCVDQYPSIINCSESDYHQIQACSNSFLSTLLNNAPWFQKAWDQIDPTRPMIIGNAAELYLELLAECIKEKNFEDLEGMNWQVGKILEKVAVMPVWKGEGSRKNQAAFKEQHEGKFIITEKEFDTIMTMLKSALRNRDFWDRLNGTWQTVVLWIEDGIPMKAMIDHITQNLKTRNVKTPGDFKTTDIGNPSVFHKKMFDRNYDMQAYHYTKALQTLYPNDHIGEFCWYVLETEYPFGSAVYTADEVILESGRAKRSAALNIAEQIYAKGELSEFPNYSPDGPTGLTLWDWQINKSLQIEQTYDE